MTIFNFSLPRRPAHYSVLTLLNPREHTPHAILALVVGMSLGALAMRWLGWPFWSAFTITLGTLIIPGLLKWRADKRRYGLVAMGLSFLILAQGFHSIEHIAQWVQYHWLGWDVRASSGLISAANIEVIHFLWNWTVTIIVTLLVVGGVRNFWGGVMLGWVLAHSLEHTYIFVRYLLVLNELQQIGITNITAQGLPGILGRDGWLARSIAICGPFLSSLPGLTTAVRLDVHFWWNTSESVLLWLAAHTYLSKVWHPAAQKSEATLSPNLNSNQK